MQPNYIESSFQKPDEQYEKTLRPQKLSEFIGQPAIKERLEVMLEASKMRGEPLSHCLFVGPPGLGKTTLAHILSKSMGTNLVSTSGPILEKPGDLAGLLTNLKQGDILFIDEIHRLNKVVEEYLYSAMEDYSLDIMIDSGPGARSIQVKLNPFTLIAATTRSGLLSAPLRTRFPFTCRLDYYPEDLLETIIIRTSSILNVEFEKNAATALAARSRGTPRIANNLLKWLRDYAQVKSANRITVQSAYDALQLLSIDCRGLDELDKRILTIIIDHHNGGPVGINTIAAAVGESPDTLEEVHEPYLIMQGLLDRTPRGRKATALAYAHLNKQPKESLARSIS